MSNVTQGNVCERCGGYKTVYYKIEPIYSNGYTPAIHTITNNTMKVCMCQPIKEKYDGKLDEDEDGNFDAEVRIEGEYIIIEVIEDFSHMVVLDAKEALSLLAWLRQEEETLKQLSQEQEHE